MTFYYTMCKFYSQRIMNDGQRYWVDKRCKEGIPLHNIPLGRILEEVRKNISGRRNKPGRFQK